MVATRRRRRTVIACLAAIACVAACLWFTDVEFSHGAHVAFWKFYVTRLGLLSGALVGLLIAFVLGVVRARRSRPVRRGLTAGFAVATVTLLLEAAFMFVPRSHNVGYTLAAKVWYHWCWGPVNSLGCRDREPVAQPGRRTVLVVGDSFTAAQGISRRDERFTERLAASRTDLNVVNLGKCGADSAEEYETLTTCPLAPDAVVLQYYMNDVEGTARRLGRVPPEFTPYADLPAPLALVVRNSFLLDFCYWQVPHADEQPYVDFVDRIVHDDAVLEAHFAELDRFSDYAAAHGVQLTVVVFPALLDLDVASRLTARVKRRFEGRGATVLDVAPLVRDLMPSERTAGGQDAHPSARVHERVAKALAATLPRA